LQDPFLQLHSEEAGTAC